MKTFKAKKNRPYGVWVSEIKLRDVSRTRLVLVRKLLAKLETEGFSEE